MLLGLHQKGTGRLRKLKVIQKPGTCLSVADADGVSSLEVSIDGNNVTAGSLQVCPGTTVSLTCSYDNTSDLTRWEIGPPIDCIAFVAHSTNPSIALCGSFIINMVSAEDQPTRMSTLVLPVDQSLNGAVATCFADSSTSDPRVGDLSLQVIGEIDTRST